MIEFTAAFEALTGNRPFPWQQAMYTLMASDGDAKWQRLASCSLPTGLGKTNVIAVWLIALANHPDRVPRRLVYVVNRRTVVDQTTDVAEKLRKNAKAAGVPEPAISTLRGQFADNRAWSADPSRPAIICGTVDMIGSRLLFSGYGVGFKSRPLHAGFLGQDVLLVHDEAHLEPAFQKLIEAIRVEQGREPASHGERHRLRVMELTATSRGGTGTFPDDAERETNERDETVCKRVWAKKHLELRTGRDGKLADDLTAAALEHKGSGRPVLVFARRVEDVLRVKAGLEKAKQPHVLSLTGTLRGKERDDLVAHPVFARLLPPGDRPAGVTPVEGTAYLVCTSAGEVGVNISADHLVCDLTPFDSMAQRFGRVNRFGDHDDTRIVVLCPPVFDPKNDYEQRQERTLGLLRRADGDASPGILRTLHRKAMEEGAGAGPLTTDRSEALREYILSTYQPQPTILPTSDILFDAWALSTVKKLPSRPKAEPYLHGVSGWQPPETYVAWRTEVGLVRFQPGDAANDTEIRAARAKFEAFAAELLEDYPLKPHELLHEPTYRAVKAFEAIAKKHSESPAWLLDDDGEVTLVTVGDLTDKDRIANRTVLLSPTVGGLHGGMLNGGSEAADDVADEWFADKAREVKRRVRVWDVAEVPDQMRLIRTIDTKPEADEADEDSAGRRYWRWYESPAGDGEGSKANRMPVKLCVHVRDVIGHAERIVANLHLPDDVKQAVITAARWHDLGKDRQAFQAVLGNPRCNDPLLAKSGKKGGRVKETYRHEFGSLADVLDGSLKYLADLSALKPDMQDLVLHLIAAHHGRGRPHFPPDEAFDPHHPVVAAVAADVPRRFARLQRRYGRWGLAYLESLLRAADYAASGSPSEYLSEDGQ